MVKTLAGAVLVMGSLLGLGAQAQLGYSYEALYRGFQLDGNIFLCKSDQADFAGFRFDQSSDTWAQVSDVSQPRNASWRVALRGARAEVMTLTDATPIVDRPAEFGVLRSTARLLLSRQGEADSGVGVFSESLTIDL